MSSTNKTTNYELSQYLGSDKPTYLGDYNSDMLKIDTQMKTNADNISSAAATANTANTTAGTALTNAATAQTTADSANTAASNAASVAAQALSKATANETDITAIEQTLGQTTWNSATLNSTYINNGKCDYIQIGNLVICKIEGLSFSSAIGQNTQAEIISGLPVSYDRVIATIVQTGNNNVGRIQINGGKIYTWYTPFGITTSPNTWYGYFCFLYNPVNPNA